MTDSVVVVEQTTPIVQVTYPAAGVVEVTRSEFGVEIENDCDVVVIGDASNVVEVGADERVETAEVNVVVEVAETGVEVVSVGVQGPTAEDIVKYQEATDIEIVGDITTIWKGEALPGLLHVSAVWRIRRIVVDDAADCTYTTTWANGDAAFDKIWEATPGDELYKTYDFDPN